MRYYLILLGIYSSAVSVSEDINTKTIEFQLGYNVTFYNATMPYCFAVTTGACYDSSTGKVIP
jgi:hypothetical protein